MMYISQTRAERARDVSRVNEGRYRFHRGRNGD